MSFKPELKNPNSCDGCTRLKKLQTIGGHMQCAIYKINTLPTDDVTMATRKAENKDTGRIERPQICKDDNKEK